VMLLARLDLRGEIRQGFLYVEVGFVDGSEGIVMTEG